MSETAQHCSMNKDLKQCHEVLVCHLPQQQSSSSTQSLPQSSGWTAWERDRRWCVEGGWGWMWGCGGEEQRDKERKRKRCEKRELN